jgi:hypothetical protein
MKIECDASLDITPNIVGDTMKNGIRDIILYIITDITPDIACDTILDIAPNINMHKGFNFVSVH